MARWRTKTAGAGGIGNTLPWI